MSTNKTEPIPPFSLIDAAIEVIRKHDHGLLSHVVRDSTAIEKLRSIVERCERYQRELNEQKEAKIREAVKPQAKAYDSFDVASEIICGQIMISARYTPGANRDHVILEARQVGRSTAVEYRVNLHEKRTVGEIIQGMLSHLLPYQN